MKYVVERSTGPRRKNEGTLQVDVAPVDKKQGRRFARFLDWLRAVFRPRDGFSGAEEVRQYIDEAKEAASVLLHSPGVKNAHLEAEISQRLAESARLRSNVEMGERLFEDKRAFQRAKTAKVRAEAEAIDVATRLKALETFRRLGFDVTPVVRDGKFEGLYVTKLPRDRYLRALQDSRPPRKSRSSVRKRDG